MIQSILLGNVATYSATAPETLSGLQTLNYIFGANGTGKSTIGRVIADPTFSADCRVTWRDGTPLQVLVLNRDFIERNFNQLPGVFTLGEKQKDTETKLAAARAEEEAERHKIVGVKKALRGDDGTGGHYAELAALETEYKDRFWAPVQRLKQHDTLASALQGVLGNRDTCKARVLQESSSNKATLKPYSELERRAGTVFGQAPTKQPDISAPDSAAVLQHESNPILHKKVIGKDDVDIAALIKRLGNSDWVRLGVPYYKLADNLCPFCQQRTPDTLAANLADYFDDEFERDSSAINSIVSAYENDTSTLQTHVQALIDSPGQFLDAEKLKAEKLALDQMVSANRLRLDSKQKEPSTSVSLDSLRPAIARVKWIIHAARYKTRAHNRLVDNLAAEKTTLTADVWRYILNELADDLTRYSDKKDALTKAITGLEKNQSELEAKVAVKVKEIRDLEKQSTSIQPTIDAINDVLSRFGFDTFTLAKADDTHYKLIRHNGEDARSTLSEGERTFVVFLYFYNLVKGSATETGTTTHRIVVFDDPISSLDSDVLFIVSSLIKEVCGLARLGSGHIKQVFVLTHNVYFHRQVTFDGNRPPNGVHPYECFWIVRKRDSESKLERCTKNPVKSSYELLWYEVRLAQSGQLTDTNTLPNVLRRILEHYYTMLGGYSKIEKVLETFAGRDKLIANDLLSFMHAGSHSVFDDAHMSPSNATPEAYLRVFKQVFDHTEHGAHYEMMLVPSPAAVATPPT